MISMLETSKLKQEESSNAKDVKSIECIPVHKDKRGEIIEIRLNGNFAGALFTTKKGYARGGESNASSKSLIMLEGKGVWFLIHPDGRKETVEQKGSDVLRLERDTFHLFVALEDSMFFRGFDSGKFEKPNYHPQLRKYATGEADPSELIDVYEKMKLAQQVKRSTDPIANS